MIIERLQSEFVPQRGGVVWNIAKRKEKVVLTKKWGPEVVACPKW